jgi:uncharacterized protein
MLPTFVNAAAVVVGSLAGILLGRRISDPFREIIYAGVGVFTLIIGMIMSIETQRVLYLALSVVIGGLLGTWWGVENGILKLGEFLKARFHKNAEGDFAYGFLSASVLFCVGAMTIVGSFTAGVDHDYQLLFTKSVMDGFMAILLASALGPGVVFSALVILVYQGSLTLLAGVVRPWVTDLMLSEISAVGGALIIMIGINLLNLRQIKTANFIPALLVIVVFVLVDPLIPL